MDELTSLSCTAVQRREGKSLFIYIALPACPYTLTSLLPFTSAYNKLCLSAVSRETQEPEDRHTAQRL